MTRSLIAALILLLARPLLASTTANNDSCDIAQQPAATLLLPYFEVDFKSPESTAVSTIFSVQNTSPLPQIAHATIWTDWGYPVLNFSIFLTGYDVQAINMYDVIARGFIAPTFGTSNGETVPINPTAGSQPAPNTANPNFLPDAATACGPGHLPGPIPAPLIQFMQVLLTTGHFPGITLPGGCPNNQLGGPHEHAVGYITIDVVGTCTIKTPADPDYYSSVLLYDNVLTGDYQFVSVAAGHQYALGGPMVHLRAVPAGGAVGSTPTTPLPYTFYDRLTQAASTRTIDRRQPLPATFAARWIEGGPGGFNTNYKIWREATTSGALGCPDYVNNSTVKTTEIIRFDEHENATVFSAPAFPLTSQTAVSSSVFPPSLSSGDAGGWMYLNLNNGGSIAYSAARASQNWVLVSMFAEPTFAVEASATMLGNGCSPVVPTGAKIQPAP